MCEATADPSHSEGWKSTQATPLLRVFLRPPPPNLTPPSLKLIFTSAADGQHMNQPNPAETRFTFLWFPSIKTFLEGQKVLSRLVLFSDAHLSQIAAKTSIVQGCVFSTHFNLVFCCLDVTIPLVWRDQWMSWTIKTGKKGVGGTITGGKNLHWMDDGQIAAENPSSCSRDVLDDKQNWLFKRNI